MTVIPMKNWTKPKADCDGVSSHEILVANPGMTYRQVHYWTATKRIQCHLHAHDGSVLEYQDGRSTGYQACYPPAQAVLAGHIYQLTRFGIEVGAAQQIATDLRISTSLFDELGRITREQWEEKR